MTTKEACEKWGNVKDTKWISERCREQLIESKKEKGKWIIDDLATCPPCTGTKASKILENICEISKGNDVRLCTKNDEENIEEILKYLEDYSYITKLNFNEDINIVVKNVKLTERAYSFIEHNKSLSVSKKEITNKAGINGKHINFSKEEKIFLSK